MIGILLLSSPYALAQTDRVIYPAPAFNVDANLPTVTENIEFSQFQDSETGDLASAAEPQTSTVSILTEPWWMPAVETLPQNLHPLDLEYLIWQAIENSPYVRSLLIEPQIQEARASQTLGVFDPTPFINSLFNDTSNPVGNTLTTGGPERLNETFMENSAGVKAKTQTGALTELAQDINRRNSNSFFSLPPIRPNRRLVRRYPQRR